MLLLLRGLAAGLATIATPKRPNNRGPPATAATSSNASPRSPAPTTSVGIEVSSWDVIGPFPQSAREQGADTLEAFGGIRGIPRGGPELYPSELASSWAGGTAGRVGWRQFSAEPGDGSGTVNVDFGDMRWAFMAASFGSSIQRARGWAVGDFEVQEASTYAITCEGVSNYMITSALTPELGPALPLNGDPYRTGWRGTQPVRLAQGTHALWVPFTTSGSTASFSCRVEAYADSPLIQPLALIERPGAGEGGRPNLFSDIVDGVLATGHGSVAVENRGNAPIADFLVLPVDDADFEVTVAAEEAGLQLAKGQQRPLRLVVQQLVPTVACGGENRRRLLKFELQATVFPTTAAGERAGGDEERRRFVSVDITIELACRAFDDEPYVFTFVDKDGSVQYAVLRSPAMPCPQDAGCPVLFATHGAGVESNPLRNPAWAGAFRQQPAAWTLLPTNRDAFGYDWQMIGYQNGLAALEALATQLPGVPAARRPRTLVDADRLLYAGHSMGGHGCLEYVTHHGDRALGAAPAAGWISMGLYTFDKLRTGDGLIDPVLEGVLYASLAEWDTDLYSSHAVGIPLLMRLGGNDTSVPPWHLRRFARLVEQESAEPDAVAISEVVGEGHWWDAVMDDDEVMQPFYDSALATPTLLPRMPAQFVSLTMNPATTSGRGGIRIEQLKTAGRLGRVLVDRYPQGSVGEDGPWVMHTENVRRFSFYELAGRPLPANGVVVDGATFVGEGPLTMPTAHLCAVDATAAPPDWQWCDGEAAEDWKVSERSSANSGPMRQVLHSGMHGTQMNGPIIANLASPLNTRH
jgi:hypothetical protein